MTTLISSSSGDKIAGNVKSTPVNFTSVKINDNFWQPRIDTARQKTLPEMYTQMEKAGYFNPAQRNWEKGADPVPYVFWESDISKWLEAASYSLATQPDPALEALVDRAIAFMVSLQQPDGYLNLYFTEVEPDKRWANLLEWHELYCAGHLIEAAVAHFNATGKRHLLDPVCRYADYIGTVFGREPGQMRGYCGHEEIELALVKLYRVTAEKRYLRLAEYFIEERGQTPHYFDIETIARGADPAKFKHETYEYNQSHLPVREQTEVLGHAVRQMYLVCAMVDLAKELQDDSLLRACENLWKHLTSKRMYVTGGIGPSADNEGFTSDYDLPNLTAYAETCAAIGLVFWNHRLLQLDADSRYADLMELALFNGVLSGTSLDGLSFFYVNPLASQGNHHRQPWFNCACCPPNLARLFMSLGQYIYGLTETGDILVHLYIQGSAEIQAGNRPVTIRQQANYPWDGQIELEVAVEEPAEFGLRLRIPGWSKNATLAVNGQEISPVVEKGYAVINRRWENGDKVTLSLEITAHLVYAHPAVTENTGRAALQRGPVVYCLEAADNKLPLDQLVIPSNPGLQSEFDSDLLGGVVVLKGTAATPDSAGWSDDLYRVTPASRKPQPFTAIPYYAWDQREPGEMRVWVRTQD
jgi:hypothetical protein